ncbi:MAG TPA: HEAT repeat domain-containing protein [Planctomycetota bacterium]|nr:HEAT repeat domain-containing protein [Planctomycetota bacterium]
MRVALCAALPVLLFACSSPEPAHPIPVHPEAATRDDFLHRLAEAKAKPDPEDVDTVMNNLEHLLPAWQTEQRRGTETPLENILTIKVVTRFDDVLAAFVSGPRERRLVAAWALGFARVPDNDLGLQSPHAQARDALVAALHETDDELLRNVLLGLWKLGDPDTPVQPVVDLLVQHHDPDVRANAALCLTAILTAETASSAMDAALVALGDDDARVRLHATGVVRRFPSAAGTERLQQLLPDEDMPLVRAAIANALGAARARSATAMLASMLSSTHEIEAVAAHRALVEIYGQDLGPKPADWAEMLQ